MVDDALTLDPKDWETTRKLGHQMIDDMIDYLKGQRSRKIWKPLPENVLASFQKPVPHSGSPLDSIYQEFTDNILNYAMGNPHPSFWGWVISNGTPTGMLAEMLAAAMNSNLGGGTHSASFVEGQVVEWLKEMFMFPPESSGLLVSGGTMANLIGLAVARNTKIPNARKEGMKRIYRMYCSTETHSSVQKSVELMGMGSDALRFIRVDENLRIDIPELEKAIEKDIANGLVPICIIGTTGTTNTGSVDDLPTLAKLAKKYNTWFHVDGAFGALTHLTPDFKYLADGIELADSLAFDLHKWMYLPYGIGAVLVKDKDAHLNAFSLTPPYLEHGTRGVAGGNTWWSDYGIELSRDFKALKVWMGIKEHGIEHIGKVIQKNIEQAQYLESLVKQENSLEVVAPVPMNIVCFRYVCDLPNEKLNAINQEILILLHERGLAVPSYTTLNGKYAIRTCITNYRTEKLDLEKLVRDVVEIGNELKPRFSD